MANAFWGGFARSLKDNIDADMDMERDLAKQDKLEQLKKKYEAEIIDSSQTQVVGNEEVRYNKYGTEISRRALSPEELAMRKAAVDKASADARRSVTEADMSDYQYGNREEDRALDRATKQAGVDQGWAHVNIARDRLNRDMTREEKDRAELVTTTLFEAGDNGDVSAMALMEQYDMELEAAKDKEDRERVIAKYLGLARNRLMDTKARTQQQYRQGNTPWSLEGTGPTLPPPNY